MCALKHICPTEMPDPQDASVWRTSLDPEEPPRRLSVSSASTTHSEASFSFTSDDTPQSSQTSVSSNAPTSPVIGKCRRADDDKQQASKYCRVQRDSGTEALEPQRKRSLFVEGLVGELLLTRRHSVDYCVYLGTFLSRFA